MPEEKLKECLEKHNIDYEIITHPVAYTAQHIAAAAHIPGFEVAKIVIIKVDGKFSMAVLPSPLRVDLEGIKKQLGAEKIELATENEFKNLFPECQVGAMPPMGNIYNMEVYADTSLSNNKHIAFNAGTHSELLRITYKAFETLVKPRVMNLATE